MNVAQANRHFEDEEDFAGRNLFSGF